MGDTNATPMPLNPSCFASLSPSLCVLVSVPSPSQRLDLRSLLTMVLCTLPAASSLSMSILSALRFLQPLACCVMTIFESHSTAEAAAVRRLAERASTCALAHLFKVFCLGGSYRYYRFVAVLLILTPLPPPAAAPTSDSVSTAEKPSATAVVSPPAGDAAMTCVCK